jgi:hypothetical protein
LVFVQLPVLWETAKDVAQSDFANYFTSAWVLSQGDDLGKLYDRDEFGRALERSGLHGLGSFIPHPPANALWLLPFVRLGPEAAKVLWTAALVAALALSTLALRSAAARLPTGVCVLLVLSPVLSIRNGLAFGQPYLVLAALLIVGTVALEKGHALLGSFLLGLGGSFKPYALVLGVLFLGRNRLRELQGFVVGAVLPSAFVWLLAGPDSFQEFLTKVLPWMLRGEIQDPFSAGWGSAMALSNRLFRFEPDLNPAPWLDAPTAARFIGSAISSGVLILGVIAGRRAFRDHRVFEAVGVVTAFSLAASPFVASYHLVLITISAAAVAMRLHGPTLGVWLVSWAVLGSSLMNVFRGAEGLLAPLAYMRFFCLLTFALVVAWPFISRRAIAAATGGAVALGAIAVLMSPATEAWPRIEAARGYSMTRPYFCGARLRWWSPSADGGRMESRGEGPDCAASASAPSAPVLSRFQNGSWNLYLREESPGRAEQRLTSSAANEVDPVMSPEGCSVVFASDQGRGLGSTALYSLDLSKVLKGCARSELSVDPR